MPSDKLYELAFAFKKTKLWQHISEEELFAVRTQDGAVLWCIVMGSIGQHIALSAYRGDSGLCSLRKLLNGNVDTFEKMILQDCVQCSFENKDFLREEELNAVRVYAKAHQITLRGAHAFPQFMSYKPYCYPWMANEEEEELLCQALEAALVVATERNKRSGFGVFSPLDPFKAGTSVSLFEKGENGFTVSSISLPEASEVFPAPEMQDELLAASIHKTPSKGIFECKLLYLDHPTQENENERPFYPALPLLIQQSSQYVVSVLPDNYQQHPEKLVWNVADALKQQKLHPSTICVQENDERTLLFLKDLCQKCGITLKTEKELPVLEEIAEQLRSQFDGNHSASQEEELLALMEMLSDMPASEFSHFPPSLKQSLLQMAAQPGFLPKDIREKILQALK